MTLLLIIVLGIVIAWVVIKCLSYLMCLKVPIDQKQVDDVYSEIITRINANRERHSQPLLSEDEFELREDNKLYLTDALRAEYRRSKG